VQNIISTSLTPEQYAEQEYHKQVKPPENCPNCDHAHTLEALGYYSRFLTQSIAAVLEILIRRFLCRHCRISVSCLPRFAQPYRVVNTPTVEAGFNGQCSDPAVQRWLRLIQAYWKRFEQHLPEVLQRVGHAFGPLPLKTAAQDFWLRLLSSCGSLAAATQELVHRFRTCLFGTYRCHQRKLLHAA
jgi:hypothetical protein